MTTQQPLPIVGLGEIADRYDGFILDLWGTLHDGATPYPGVLPCLEALHRAGKRCVLLSNAPRRAQGAVGRVTEIGILPRFYEALVTSGEVGWQALSRRNDPATSDAFLRKLGSRCFYLGPGKDHSMLEGLAVDRVASIDDCDFVLCTGLLEGHRTPQEHEPLLARAAAAQRPLVCVNPDLIIHRVGTLEYCAGALAERYAELGGPVRYFGKPHPSTYAATFDRLAGVARARLLAVGDSLRTDIAGANAAGIDSLLLTGGIHVEELGASNGQVPPGLLSRACTDYGAWPTFVAAQLAW